MILPVSRSLSFIRFVSSSKLTVICLFLLVTVVIWGTVYQVNNGLYQAQQKFFYSWVILLFGFIPIPGAILIFWTLFFNVLGSLLFRIHFRFSNIGNILTHLGILIFFVGSFFSFYYSQESDLGLKEGEESNFSVSGMNWEIAVWSDEKEEKLVYAVDSDRFKRNDRIHFEKLQIQIEAYHKNCTAHQKSRFPDEVVSKNASGILHLEPRSEENDPFENIPGVIFSIEFSNGKQNRVLLYGADREPTSTMGEGQNLFFALRKKRFILPFSLKLIDFKRTFHPGSEIARSYESKLEMRFKGLSRNVIISMNKPLRYGDFTLYQSSFFISPDGAEYTYLAVVKNWGRSFPYISSFMIFLGLCIHFLLLLFLKRKNTKGHSQNS